MSGVTMSPARQEAVVASLDFADAIRQVIDGRRVRRLEWQDADVCVFRADGFLKIRKSDGTLHALLVSDGDLLAMDWVVIREH